jgi:hypothetical protein
MPDDMTPACGNGEISFDITAVQAKLLTTTDVTSGVNLAANVPINVVTLGGGVNSSRELNNTQTLTYHLWPIYGQRWNVPAAGEVAPSTTVSSDEMKKAPIANAILNLGMP